MTLRVTNKNTPHYPDYAKNSQNKHRHSDNYNTCLELRQDAFAFYFHMPKYA